jgi:murein DD-endopeptidase MepM/ murein hydrolase activator NlpD
MTHAIRTPGLLRSRDLFVHDGTKLRRIRLSATVQFAFFVAAALMLAWSAFAAAHFIGGEKAVVVTGDTTQLQQLAVATEQRARLIEQRQKLLATMLTGGDVDPSALAVTSDAASLPAAISAPLDRAETRLAAEEAAAAERLEQRYRTATRELKKLGLSPQRLAVGGPFEPATKSDPTFKALFNSWKKLDSLQDGVIAVPSDKPVRTAEFTSSFGIRNDPFGRGAAMHAGIDLAGPVGTPIYATADGTVTEAAYNNGGYGNLIKLDHGRGIETRYGHLASFSVRAGERIKRGQLIGRMGSTGRSTGSHLHYEVRIDGRAVNPIPFMRSTDYLVAIKSRNGHSMDQIALGGPARSNKR